MPSSLRRLRARQDALSSADDLELRRPMGLLAVTVTSSGDSADRPGWQSGSVPQSCYAGRPGRDEILSLHLGDEAHSGIGIKARAFDAMQPGVPDPRLTLRIDGEVVVAAALGTRFGAGTGVAFTFDLRALLERHPDRFRLAVHRDGAEIYRTEVAEEARKAVQKMKDCDAERRAKGDAE